MNAYGFQLNKLYRLPILPAVLVFFMLPQLGSAGQKTDLLAAYVLYAQGDSATVPIARVILNGTARKCPFLQTGDQDPAGNRSMTPRINPDKRNFPITVCEALYPVNQTMHVSATDVQLPALRTEVKSMVVFGDTGCKPSKQDCDDPAAWPFADLIRQAAGNVEGPDLVLHVGDYNYRGTPGKITIHGVAEPVRVYDGGDNARQGVCQLSGGYHGQNSPGSEVPDSWAAWQADFFIPAQPLLLQAPWVFARGNHELCSRAGNGWFYLLDPNSPLLGEDHRQLSCPDQYPQQPVLTPPYLLSFGKLNLAVLDSANACDSGLLHAGQYIDQFKQIRHLADNAPGAAQTWLISHRPLWGVDKLDAGGSCGSSNSEKYCFVNQTLEHTYNQASLPDRVNLVLSGHLHRFQSTGFDESRPSQLVVGTGGTALAKSHPKKAKEMKFNGSKASIYGRSEFGYMKLLPEKKSWKGILIGPSVPEIHCQPGQLPLCSRH